MSAKPFDIGPVIARLRARVVKAGALRQVEGRAAFAQVNSLRDFPAPCGYVLLANERANPATFGSAMPGQQEATPQVVPVGFGVVLALSNRRGLADDELRDDLRDQVGLVRDALLGWTPPVPGGRPVQLLAGDLEEYDADTVLWADRYLTQHIIQPEISA